MIPPPGADARYEPAAGILSRKVGDEIVLVDLDGELYFSLNPSGSVAWGQLAAGSSFDTAVAAVVEAFEVDPTVARADLSDLVAELVDTGLLESR